MAFDEVAKSAYQSNFKLMYGRFVDLALIADDKLNPNAAKVISSELQSDISIYNLVDIQPPESSKITRDFHMAQSAALFALIYTQDKGANIKRRLMKGKNSQASNGMYLQQKTDREYLEYMNKRYPNFCQLVNILEPSKAKQIEIVAGYLLTK